QTDTREVETAAIAVRTKLVIVKAATREEIETAFATVVQQRVGALVIHADAFFSSKHERLAALALRHTIPSIFYLREFAVVGGLMSLGASMVDGYRRARIYVARILRGKNPADLPVQQSTKVELVINMKTAKTLGLTIPQSLLLRTNEVIE